MSLAIKIGSNIYREEELFGKTLYAAKTLPKYKSYLSVNPMGYISANTPVGIYRGFVANGYKGSKQSYIIIGPNSQNTSVVPYEAQNFSSYALDSQGTKTAKDEILTTESANQPWYVKITKTIVPWIVVAGGVLIYLKNKK